MLEPGAQLDIRGCRRARLMQARCEGRQVPAKGFAHPLRVPCGKVSLQRALDLRHPAVGRFGHTQEHVIDIQNGEAHDSQIARAVGPGRLHRVRESLKA